jgi:hypothetical protein
VVVHLNKVIVGHFVLLLGHCLSRWLWLVVRG